MFAILGVLGLLTAAGGPLPIRQTPVPPPACDPAANPPQLTVLGIHSGRLAPGATACFGLTLEQGEFVRISIAAGSGYLRARALPPSRKAPLQVTLIWSFFPSLPLAFEAPAAGAFTIELSVPSSPSITEPVPFQVHLQDRIPRSTQAARREDIRADSRTEWLREHAVRLRSIAPGDEDYSDLQFLREDLRGVRVVMLGEPDHGGGSDFKAKTRLIKFLHQEMGFDVLAFESGLLTTALAWKALQAGEEPRAAFLKGVFGVMGRSEQAGPLLEYVRASARGSDPLELAGVDSQFSGTARAQIVPELLEFLRRAGVETPIANEGHPATQMLSGVIAGRFGPGRDPIPAAAEQASAARSLQAAAGQLDALGTRESAFWGQMLRSTAVQMGLALDNLRDPGDAVSYGRGRDRQMAENLIWLANHHYRGRKIIVWAHTFHVMRDPSITDIGKRQGMTMGRGVWEALGHESFSIGLTSYQGTTHWLTQPDGVDQDLIPDQHPAPEFEEMMAAAGHTLAYVNLRRSRQEGLWLGGSFVASALYLMPEKAVWSDALDALIFIRTQEPSRMAAGVK